MKSIRLTHTFVKSVTRPGRYGDGRGGLGLSLLVKKTVAGRCSKTWAQRLRINRKITTMGFGSYPVVTLADARIRALDNARRVYQGEDILKPPPIIPTVEEAFDIVIEQRRPSWKGENTEATWGLTKRYCKPISSKPVSEVKQQDIIDVLAPIWQEKPRMARVVRSNLSTVMIWAINREYRATNPATPATVKELGKQPPGSHHPSLPEDQLGSALAKIRDADVWWAEKYCLIFLAFTGVRSGEARKATWEQINLDSATWTIPGSRMKNSVMHKVPLSTQAMEILLYAREQTGRSEGLIFPPQRGGDHIGPSRLSLLMRKLEIPAVPHGDRSSVRNWAGGRADIAQPAAEMILGHKQGEKIQQVYMTSDFFEHRRPMMQEWADFLTKTMGPTIGDEQKPQEKARIRPDPIRGKGTPATRKIRAAHASKAVTPAGACPEFPLTPYLVR